MRTWRDIREFKDRAQPALFRLADDARSGRVVPPTMWAPAAEHHGPPWNFGPWPLALRIAVPEPPAESEDDRPLIAAHPGEFRRLYDTLAERHPEGTIYVQSAASAS